MVQDSGGDSPSLAARRHAVQDPLYSVAGLLNGDGTCRIKWRYSPFGTITSEEPSGDSGWRVMAFGFTGQKWDAGVNLLHFKARAYDPVLGRFLQRDPAGFVDGSNLYEYVAGRPHTATDPTGMWTFEGMMKTFVSRCMSERDTETLLYLQFALEEGFVIEKRDYCWDDFDFEEEESGEKVLGIRREWGLRATFEASDSTAATRLKTALHYRYGGFLAKLLAAGSASMRAGFSSAAAMGLDKDFGYKTGLGEYDRHLLIQSQVRGAVLGNIISDEVRNVVVGAAIAGGGGYLLKKWWDRRRLRTMPSGTKRVRQDVYMVDKNGKDLGQLDVWEVRPDGKCILIEEKDGTKLFLPRVNKKTGVQLPPPSEKEIADWAENQILEAGRKKARGLKEGVATRGTSPAITVPRIEEIRKARTIRFEVRSTDSRLRREIERRLAQLRLEHHDLEFVVEFVT